MAPCKKPLAAAAVRCWIGSVDIVYQNRLLNVLPVQRQRLPCAFKMRKVVNQMVSADLFANCG
jgi:hypothetical protein